MSIRFTSKLKEAEYKAIDALSRYKFMMFGYWAAIWVHHAKDINPRPSNPFLGAVKWAKQERVKTWSRP